MSDFKTPASGTPIPSMDDRLEAAIARQRSAQAALIEVVTSKDELLFKAKALVVSVMAALGLLAEGGLTSAGAGMASPLVHQAMDALTKKALGEITKHQSDAAQGGVS